MKYHFVIALLLFSFSPFAQEKGASPINNSTIQPSNYSSTYAVVVGISDYQDEGIPDLRFADKDAEAFAAFLQSPAGGSLDEDHLKLLTNEKATLGQLVAELYWLLEECKEGDVALIYFSGHGDVELKTISQPGFLLCWDAPARIYLGGGSLALPMFQDIISTLSTQMKVKVIVVTDACRSGKLAGSKIGGTQITGASLAQKAANEIKILSCQPEEYSIEGEQWGGGRGAFSFHLVNGLYGLADGNQDLNVNLLEINRYVQDKVMTEVAPESQLPMMLGNGRENISTVVPEVLAQLNQHKNGLIPAFKSTESKGIEEEVLAAVDTNIRKTYVSFKQSLNDKTFFKPIDACADNYYEQLIKVPELERLHNSMRRNYAAALQDEAQQAMKELLDPNSAVLSLSKKTLLRKFGIYPKALDRAAEILGAKHYMYKSLKAWKYYFEGYLLKLKVGANANQEMGDSIINICYQSLAWEPSYPHVLNLMSRTFGANLKQRDSMMHYFRKSIEKAPFWQKPYVNASASLRLDFFDFEKAKELLDSAKVMDENAMIWRAYGYFYFNRHSKEYSEVGKIYLDQAESSFKKAIAIDSNYLPSIISLGFFYNNTGRPLEGEKVLKRGIGIDSTNASVWANLAISYRATDRKTEAIKTLQNIIPLDSTSINIYVDLARNYLSLNDMENAGKYFKRAYDLDSTSLYYHRFVVSYFKKINDLESAEKSLLKPIEYAETATQVCLPCAYIDLSKFYEKTNQLAKAEQMYKKLTLLYPDANSHHALGYFYYQNERLKEAEQAFLKTLSLDSMHLYGNPNLGVVYAMAGKYEEAERQLEKCLELHPKIKIFIHINYAVLYAKQNKLDDAFEQLEKAFELGYNLNNRHVDLRNSIHLEAVRAEKAKWNALLNQYFPEENKD